MLKSRLHVPLTAAAAVLALAAAQNADAGVGARGRAFTAHRTVARSQGSTSVSRGVQGAGGHGVETTRNTSYGDGGVSNTVTRTYDDGRTAMRTGSVTRNGDGSVTAERSHTGAAGNTQSGWSTVYHTDDGVARSRGFTTSGGRSATETGSVAFAPGEVTVDRTVATGSGATVSRSATYTRGD